MSRIFSSVLLVVAVALLASRSGAEDAKTGTIELFNGKDLTGWRYEKEPEDVLRGKPESTDGRYVAKDGVIAVQPSDEPNHGKRLRQLYTVQKFPGDFELRLEFRAAVNADSGLFIRGPQLQVRDYPVAGPYKELKKYKPQDWNEIVVVVKDNVAHCTCNGEVLEAALKVSSTGPIGLESDRGLMEYRNIRLTPTK